MKSDKNFITFYRNLMVLDEKKYIILLVLGMSIAKKKKMVMLLYAKSVLAYEHEVNL